MKHKYQLLLLLLMLTSEIVLFSADRSSDNYRGSDEANYWFSRLCYRSPLLDQGPPGESLVETLYRLERAEEQAVLMQANQTTEKATALTAVINSVKKVSKYRQRVNALRDEIYQSYEIHKNSNRLNQELFLYEIRHGNNMSDFKAALSNVPHLKIYSAKGKTALELASHRAPKYMQALLNSQKNVLLSDKETLLDTANSRRRGLFGIDKTGAEKLRKMEQSLLDDHKKRFEYTATLPEDRLTPTVGAFAEAAAVSSIVKRKPSAAASDSDSSQVKHSRREKADSGVDE